jgi:hypothetical protein
VSEATTSSLTHALFEFSSYTLDVINVLHGMEIGREIIRHELSEAATSIHGRFLAERLGYMIEQIRSDVEYFRTMQQRANLAFEAQRTLGMLNLVKVGHMIAIVAFGISLFLGAEPVFMELFRRESTVPPGLLEVLLSFLASLVFGIVVSGATYWFFFGRRQNANAWEDMPRPSSDTSG